ncbi:MAG TPA: glycosyltransferase family 39 protein [Gemmatimonadaceae bacterium]|nr:glycosyltransferase family 39 protein [Gemmatimonadaceae bacterium]
MQRRGAALADTSVMTAAVAVVAILATVARLREFLERRSLWFDEAAVAMNIVQRSFRELLLPLDHEQTAPPLFLWAERVAYLVGGNTELALRTFPLIAGLLLPVAMWFVAKRYLPAPEALIAAALIGLSPFLVYYATEIKPYGIDALVTTLLFVAALRLREQPHVRRRWVELALGGAVALAMAIPAPLVLAGVTLFLVAQPDVRRAPNVIANAAIVAVAWVVSAALVLIVYLPVMRHDSFIGSFMQHYWGSTFLTTEPPGLKERALNAVAGATRTTFLDGVMWPQQTNMIIVVALAGLVRIARSRGWAWAAMLVVPLGLLTVAAALRMYPLGERVILFAAPITALLLVAGITWPIQLVRDRWRPVAAVIAGALVLAIPASRAFGRAQPLPGRAETREMVHELIRARQQTPRPVIWLSAGSVMAWRYYAGAMEAPVIERTPGAPLPQIDSIAPGILVGKWPFSDEAKRKPDWGMWELDRIRSAGRDCGYMLLSVYEPDERAKLVGAIERSGSRIASSHTAQGAELLRVCFPPT